MTDRTPFALIYNYGRRVAFTAEQYAQAERVARMCRCGTCDCCAVVAYVREHEVNPPPR